MDNIDKLHTLEFIRPNAVFTLRGDEIEWLDTAQTQPTEKEIADGFTAMKSAKEAQVAEQEAAKTALLTRLGITADEAKLLLA
jgi:hypothetical protein